MQQVRLPLCSYSRPLRCPPLPNAAIPHRPVEPPSRARGNSSTPVVAVAGSTGVTINVLPGASVSASHNIAVPFPILSVDQSSAINNNGTLSLSGGAGSGTNRGAAMLGNLNGNTLTNAAGATINTTGAFNDGMAANGSGNTLINNGTITTTGPNAYGMTAAWGQTNTGQLNNVLINTGTVLTSGSNARAASILGGSGTINNSGTLSTMGASSNAALPSGQQRSIDQFRQDHRHRREFRCGVFQHGEFELHGNDRESRGWADHQSGWFAIRTLNGSTTIINAGLVKATSARRSRWATAITRWCCKPDRPSSAPRMAGAAAIS